MAKTKTLHTGGEFPGRRELTIPSVTLEEFGRTKTGGWAEFVCSLPKNNPLGALGKYMGWNEPGEKEKDISLDGTLDAYNILMTPKNEDLGKNEQDLEVTKVLAFKIKRLEIKGKRGKGFRWELRFQVSFSIEDGLALLESYYIRVSPSPMTALKISYTEPAEQTVIEEVMATEEQQQAVLEMDDSPAISEPPPPDVGASTLASARQVGAGGKRKRLASAAE